MARPCRVPPVRVGTGQKFCFHCSTIKPYAEFAADRAKFDGLRPMCRVCDAGRAVAYRAVKAGKPIAERIAQSRRNWQELKADLERSLSAT